MQKIFLVLVILLMITSNVFAMTLSQPTKIGEISVAGGPQDGIKISGATTVKDYSTIKKSGNYKKGYAIFGKSLYFYFNKEYYLQNYMSVGTDVKKIQRLDSKVSRFGGTNVKNSVPIFTFEGMTEIYKIENDSGLELYVARSETGGGGGVEVFGTTKQGKWVRYFDTIDARKSFGMSSSAYIRDFFTFGDEIIVQYGKARSNTSGELRYKWNEASQWFGVENKASADLLEDLKRTSNSANRFSVSVGSGMGLIIDSSAILTEKANNGCIISLRAVYIDSNRKPDIVECGRPLRYFYNFGTKKIYSETTEKNKSTTWKYVDPKKDGKILEIAEVAYRFAYNKDFFNKPISPRLRNLR